jgi:uncharacterized protein involved in exopolysaccharide biosynthesis
MLYGFLAAMFKHRRVALAMLMVWLLAGAGYVLLKTPEYESVAKLVVRFGDRSIPDVDRSQVTELTQDDRREIVLAHATMLTSHDLAERTVKSFGIATLYPDIAENPSSGGTPADEAVKQFSDHLAVDVGMQDNVITVSFMHPDKMLAARVVKKLIDLYIAGESAVYQNPQQSFLRSEVKQAGDRLATAQAALEKFKDQWRITDYDQETADLLKQRGDVDINLRTAQASLALAQNRAQDLARQMRKVPTSQAEPASGEKYRALDDAKTQLGALRLKRSQMLATYAPTSPAMTTVDAGIAAAQEQVQSREGELAARSSSTPNTVYQSLQTDFLRNAADAQSNSGPVKVLTEQLAAIDQRLHDLQQNRGAFDNLTRARQIAEDTYKSLSLRYEDARVKSNLNEQGISPASVISQPTIPYRPARPRKLIILAACLFCGMVFGIGAALWKETFNNRFSTAEQVAVFLDMPVIGSFERDQRHVRSPLLESPS